MRRGRLKQSVSRWCYGTIPLPELCRAVAEMGLLGIDLLEEKDWPVVRDHGLVCTMGSGAGATIAEGINDSANHDRIVSALLRVKPVAEAHGVNVCVELLNSKVDHPGDQRDRTRLHYPAICRAIVETGFTGYLPRVRADERGPSRFAARRGRALRRPGVIRPDPVSAIRSYPEVLAADVDS